jgi:hypothetical protein
MDGTGYDNEFDTEAFRRIGDSLPMPGEIDKEQLKRVPEKSKGDDVRRSFFSDPANSTKYYYMPVGDVPQNSNRNTLVPLGTFLGFINYRGQVPISDDQYVNNDNFSYLMRFSNPPFNNGEGTPGAIGMEANPLIYTDTPPVAGSVPLTYSDYIEQFYPGQLANIRGGKKTRNRKNRKSKRSRKYKKKSKRLNKN